ncbi:MAG: DUF4245 domain-containing protein [Dermatophilaceae bacterium]
MTTPAPPRSRYSLGSAKNLVYSMLAVVGMTAVLVLVVPRVNSVSGPPVDVAATAAQVQRDTGWPIVTAEGLPEGWRETSARYSRTAEEVMAWHAGYQTPEGTYIAVEQARDPAPGWLSAQTNRAPREGTLQIGGRAWLKLVRDTKTQNSLVAEPSAPGELTTLVTGTASFDEMSEFIGYLRPVAPAG